MAKGEVEITFEPKVYILRWAWAERMRRSVATKFLTFAVRLACRIYGSGGVLIKK